MARDVLETIANYEFQLRHGMVKLRPGLDVAEQVSRYGESAVRDSILVAGTREILNDAGVPSIMFSWYYAFVRKLNKRLNGPDGPRYSGQTASEVAAVHVAEWVARGLTQSLLADIVVNVLNISYPPQP